MQRKNLASSVANELRSGDVVPIFHLFYFQSLCDRFYTLCDVFGIVPISSIDFGEFPDLPRMLRKEMSDHLGQTAVESLENDFSSQIANLFGVETIPVGKVTNVELRSDEIDSAAIMREELGRESVRHAFV